MVNLTTSIALCTYNGAMFIDKQLQSFLSQSLLPNELVVCDDGSTDQTLEIVQKFAQNAPFEIKIFRNEEPLGVTKNFEKALSLCQNELLFLCDQDDVWFANKIEKTVQYFLRNPNCKLAISDAKLIDSEGNTLKKHLLEILRMRPPQRQQWLNQKATFVMLGGNRVAGCVTAFRRDFLQKSIPFPTDIPTMIHDGWLGFLAALDENIGLIETPLVQYRQHATQQIGASSQKAQEAVSLRQRFARPRSQKIAPILEELTFLNTFKNHAFPIFNNAKGWQEFDKKVQFLNFRATLPKYKLLRIFPVAIHLLSTNYHKYADQEATWTGGFLTALGDIFE